MTSSIKALKVEIKATDMSDTNYQNIMSPDGK